VLSPRARRATRPGLVLAYAPVVAFGAACATQQKPGAARAGAPPSAGVVSEARAFMDAYARDLLAGNRRAIAERYDRSGAYLLGNGRKQLAPYDSIVARYGGPAWSPPRTFEWRDLSFEPVGPDAVVVAGRFLWGTQAGGAPLAVSYSALLHRQEGVLRIRLEDESIDPSTLPAARPARDSAATRSAGLTRAERVVRDFVDAYNRHDVSAMLALTDTAVAWLSIVGDSVRAETRGADALRRSMEGYFRSVPTARSTIEALRVLGPWVTVEERAHWTAAAGPRSQAAVAVYEVRGDRIRRVWYYPAVREPASGK
jgi:hypothetical protein